MNRDPALAAVIMPAGASLFEVAVPISIFGVDRTSIGGPALRVAVVSAGGNVVAETTAGLVISGFGDLDMLDEAALVIVPTWPDPAVEPSGELRAALRHAVDTGATVMGLCLGAYALGYAGLLDGRNAITHWHWLSDFARRFPDTHINETSLYVDEGRIITSAGSAAAIDACLHYVRREWGAAAASAIARRMVVAPHRAGSQNQFVEPGLLRTTDMPMAALQAKALAALTDGISMEQLASWYGKSRRSFDRDFRAATGQSPLQWLLSQRIALAQQLLETTDLTVEAVAHRVGFGSAVALRPHFRRILGVSPNRYREGFHATPRQRDDRRRC